LNPVRTRKKGAPIPPDRRGLLADYAWSSHRAYAGLENPPEWLSLEWLHYWGRKQHEAVKEYKRDIASVFGTAVATPFEDLRGGLVLGGEGLWEEVKHTIHSSKGLDELRWSERERAVERAAMVKSLAEKQPDQRVQIWARVKLGGEKMADLAREFGYRDGSGITRVVERLEDRAEEDRKLSALMSKLRSRTRVSSVKS